MDQVEARGIIPPRVAGSRVCWPSCLVYSAARDSSATKLDTMPSLYWIVKNKCFKCKWVF